MTTEKCMTKASVLYLMSMLLGALVSWEYCGFELMGLACFYLLRATWNEATNN